MITKRRTEIVLLVAGLLLVSLGSWLNFLSQERLQDFWRKQFILSENSLFQPYWRKYPMKIKTRIYFFNWTNPSNLKEPGYKPKLEEVGPFTFEEISEKVDVTWNHNGTVTYKKFRSWFSRPEDSNGSLTDVVNTLNPVAASTAYFSRYWSPFARKSMSIPITLTQRMHVTKTIGELTFDGYSDPLLGTGRMIPSLASIIPIDRAGYFYGMNGTTFEGVINMETGLHGLEKLGKVNSWNYQNVTRYYDLPCGEVRGGAVDFWPPKLKKTEDIVYFCSEVCKFLVYKYKKTVIVQGIEGYLYEFDPENVDNGTSNFENRCLCGDECVPSGVLNISACRFGAPSFTSYAHFLISDQSYRDAVEGMKPDPEKHLSYMILEPTYGIVLELAARVQLNLMVQPDADISLFNDVPRIFFPIFWMEHKVALPVYLVILIKLLLALPTVCYVLSIVFIVLGILSFVLIFIIRIRLKYKNSLMDINLSFDNRKKQTTITEKEVKSPLMTSNQKLEILPEIKESDM